MEESKTERYLVREVRKIKGRAPKFVSPGSNGMPDRIVILPGGRVIFVELKAKRKDLEPMQKLRRKQLRALGCKVVKIDSEEEVDKFIRGVKV